MLFGFMYFFALSEVKGQPSPVNFAKTTFPDVSTIKILLQSTFFWNCVPGINLD